jgi:hypothetical protein
VLALNGAVQAGDVLLGVVQRQVAQSVGPACFAAALFAAGWWLTRRQWRHAERPASANARVTTPA